MGYLIFKFRRVFWTLICKAAANFAELTKWSVFLSLLDVSLTKRNMALSDEATFCLKVINKWQKRAKLCVLAHHENEKVLKSNK